MPSWYRAGRPVVNDWSNVHAQVWARELKNVATFVRGNVARDSQVAIKAGVADRRLHLGRLMLYQLSYARKSFIVSWLRRHTLPLSLSTPSRRVPS